MLFFHHRTAHVDRRQRILIAAGVVCVLVIGFALLPLPGAIWRPPLQTPITVTDREGRLLFSARQTNFGAQAPIAFEEIPTHIRDGLVAMEDRGFYGHPGVSIRGVARASQQNLRSGRVISGGSTLTQQLVRIRLNPKRRSVSYKLREMYLALKVDALFSKEEILEQYLNSVYFGHQAYGLRSAAQTYFGKEPGELSIAESALLIGVVQSPVSLDPFKNRAGAIARRDRVLNAWVETGVITAEDAEQARNESLRLAPDRVDILAPHFVFWALEQAGEDVAPGAELRTTLDLTLQQEIERIVDHRLLELAEKNATSAAVVVLDAKNGDILTMIGSADYFDALHDGAVNVAIAARQPGSALKPFTYALALAGGDTAATTVADTEVQLLTEEGNPYTPRNYDYDLHGLVRYREALANSYNIAAVKVLEKVGVQRFMEFLRRAGITTLTRDPEFYGLALTLGSGEVRLLELAEAYGIFPRGGVTLHTRTFLDEPVVPGDTILDPRVAWIISNILSDASARLPEFGEGTPLSVPPHRVAAKTGTTRNARDNWVVGYTSDRIVGVWVGNADNTPMKGTSGVTGAGPIFRDAMAAALRGMPPADFPRPAGMSTIAICPLSGKLPTSECSRTMQEVFVAGTEPTEPDDIYRRVPIDRRNGLLANASCPEEFVEQRTFTLFPADVRSWARENGFREPPVQVSPLCGGVAEGLPDVARDTLHITQPQPGDSYLLDPLIPDENEQITLEARAGTAIHTVEWLVDDVLVGTGTAPDFRIRWRPIAGVHRIVARTVDQAASVQILVENGVSR
jgi:penicillin-binding protein 1C